MTNLNAEELQKLQEEIDNAEDTSRYGEAILTDPDKLIAAFEVATDIEDKLELALFAETLSFNDENRPTLVKHLWKLIKEIGLTREERAIVILCSAIRKMWTGLPNDRFDEVAALFDLPLCDAAIMSLQTGLVYRSYWDCEAVANTKCPKLCQKLYDIVVERCPEEFNEIDLNSNIVSGGVLALYVLNQPVEKLLQIIKDKSKSWLFQMCELRIKQHARHCKDEHLNFPPVELY